MGASLEEPRAEALLPIAGHRCCIVLPVSEKVLASAWRLAGHRWMIEMAAMRVQPNGRMDPVKSPLWSALRVRHEVSCCARLPDAALRSSSKARRAAS
jgi:hypothetical protein